MKAVSFDDLIPQQVQVSAPSAASVSFDDLIPKQNPQQGFKPDLAQSGNDIAQIPQDLAKRGAHIADITNQYNKNGGGVAQGALAAYNTAGTEVGAAGDVLGGIAKAAYHAMPDLPFISDNPKEVISTLVKSPLGKTAIAAAQQGGQMWDDFKTKHPDIGNFLEATGNIATAFTPIQGKSAASIVGDVGETAIKGTAETTAKGINSIADAMKSTPLPTSEALKGLASDAYKIAEAKGGTLTPEFANKFYDNINELKPQTEHGIATIGNDALAKLSEDWKPLKGKPITLQAAQEMDEGLSQKIDGFVDKTTGKLDKEGQKLYDVQTKLRNAIEDVTPSDIIGEKKIDPLEAFQTLKDGRALWSTALRIGDMERIIARAQMTDNPATSIKIGFRTLYNNPSRMRGYNLAEKEAIKQAAESGVIGNTMRTVLGSRLLGAMAGSVAGASTGGIGAIVGAGLGAAQSGVSRKIATSMQTNRANKAIRTVGNRASNIGKLSPKEALQKIKTKS